MSTSGPGVTYIIVRLYDKQILQLITTSSGVKVTDMHPEETYEDDNLIDEEFDDDDDYLRYINGYDEEFEPLEDEY